MAQTMFKYEVLVGQPTVHEMDPDGVVELVLAPTPDVVVFWARVNDAASTRPRAFQVSGTGQPMQPTWDYCGSAAAPLGLMWHLWSRSPR